MRERPSGVDQLHRHGFRSVQQFADTFGLNIHHVRNALYGRCRPNRETLLALTNVLGVHPSDIFTESQLRRR